MEGEEASVCDKPVGEETAGEIASCGWNMIKGSVASVVNHRGGATITDWIVTLFAVLGVLILLAGIFRRRA